MRKTTGLFLALFFFAVRAPAFAAFHSAWHLGEAKDIDVDIQYFDYVYLLPDGEPVYYIGSPMRYQVTLKNTGNRSFNNFQAKSTARWSDNFSCQRFWYDNQNASFQKDALMPGNADSGLHPAEMGKQGQASYMTVYNIPMEVCPGQGYIRIEGRHQNSSGKDEVASFDIPIKVKLEKK